MKVLVVCAGEKPSRDLFEKETQECDYSIAVDGGAAVFYENKVKPDLMVGDFDSLRVEILESFREKGVNIEKFAPEKDLSDTAIALEKALERGCDEITFLGCTGGRFDHTYANILLLDKVLARGLRGRIVDGYNCISLIEESCIIKKEKKYISFFAYKEEVKGLSLKGFKYPLEGFNLKHSNGLCISNEIVHDYGEVFFQSGKLMVVHSDG